jgi:peptide/nickel transport system permease protein
LRALIGFMRSFEAMSGLIFLTLIAAGALAAPLLYPDDPLGMVTTPFLWPGQGRGYPLGSDSLGRDVCSEMLWGARISLAVGFAATMLGLTLCTFVGAAAGYFGGWVDEILSRCIEVFHTPPGFVLLLVIVAIFHPTSLSIIFAIAIVNWPIVARLTRAEFRVLRERDFVIAARGLGYGHARILFHEILPNALPPLIATSSVMVGSAILTEAALSFLGLGDPNVVSWGSMIGDGRDTIRDAWYLSALPGLAIVLTVLAFNLIANGINDALNPRFSEERS